MMTILIIILCICSYDLCGVLTILYLNHADGLDTVDGADNVIALVFWPLLVFTRIGMALYRIVRRLTK